MIFKRLFNGLLKQILSFAKMTDEALWLEIQQGNEKSYRAVFYKYYKLLVSIALRYVGDIDLAKDLAQDVFLKMWEKRGKITINHTLKAYLCQAARNTCLNHLKSQRQFNDIDAVEEPSDTGASAVEHLEAQDLQMEIDRALASMPPACRTVFMLRRMEGMSLKEIAAQLDISPKTVENQITKARKILMTKLKHLISVFLVALAEYSDFVGDVVQNIVY